MGHPARRRALALAIAACMSGSAYAQCVPVTAVDVATTENFDTLASSGTANALDLPGWYLLETGTSASANGLYRAGIGADNGGDTYSFGGTGSSDRALGSLRSGTLVPSYGACFVNNTGGTITALDIAVTGEQWRLGTAGRADVLQFGYSTDATSLDDGSWQSATDLDIGSFVTTGTPGARDGNAAEFRGGHSTSITGLSIAPGETVWLRWNDNDAAGADDGLAIDDFSLTARGTGGGGLPVVSIGSQTAPEGDTGTTPFMFTLSLSAPAGPGGVEVDFATADGSAAAPSDYVARTGTATIAAGATSTTLNIDVVGDGVAEADETFHVDIGNAAGAVIGVARGTGTIVNDDFLLTPIHAIQGPGTESPIAGQVVTTVGIVTGRKTNGYFVQTADSEADADPATSEGLFVFTSAAGLPAAATPGTRVRVTGTVTEYVPAADPAQLPLTQLTNTSTSTLAIDQPLPAAVVLTTDDLSAAGGLQQLERYEGMRVTVRDAEVVAPSRGNVSEANASATGNGLFGVVLAGVDRPMREPGLSAFEPAPADAPLVPRWDTNPELIAVDSDVLGFARVEVSTGCRIVDDSLTGPLDYTFRFYTVSPERDLVADCTGVGPQAAPLPTADEVSFATYNLQRFFDDDNDPATSDPVLTAAALERRLSKASIAIRDYLHAPDVVGVSEVENLSVLELLAARVNADAVAAGDPDPGYVARLQEGFDVGGIDVGFLVREGEVAAGVARVEVSAVEQIGVDAMLENPDGSETLLNDRPPLLMDAVVRFADGRALPVTVLAVHQRSLNDVATTDPGDDGWATVGDRVRAKRQAQADDLAQRIQAMQAASPDRRIVVLGDFNAFEFNDGFVDAIGTVTGLPSPDAATIVEGDGEVLVDPALVNMTHWLPQAERYSFVFDYNAQSLDHVLVNQALVDADDVAGLAIGHARINADFAETLRNDPATPTRLSDHDPTVLRVRMAALAFADLAVTADAVSAAVGVGETLAWTAEVGNQGPDGAAFPGVGFAVDAVVDDLAVVAPAGWSCDAAEVDAGSTSIACAADELADGADAAFAVTATAPQAAAGDDVLLTVAATSQTEDLETGDNSASDAIAVSALADLAVAVQGPDTYVRGAVQVFTVDVSNLGPSVAAATSLRIAVEAPKARVALSPLAGWTCAAVASREFAVDCTPDGGSLAAGTASFSLSVATGGKLAAPNFTVAAGIAADVDDPAAANNTAVKRVRLVGGN